MRLFSVIAGVITTIVAPPIQSVLQPDMEDARQESHAANTDQSLSHLPETAQKDILAWRTKLIHASSLKVICEINETRVNLHQYDESGKPRVVLHEQYQAHSWMSSNDLWLVIYSYKDGVLNPDPAFQMYWDGSQQKVWRELRSTEQPYTFSYAIENCDEVFGPSNPGFNSSGCSYASVTQSWLAGGVALSERVITLQSIALMRKPNIAVIPPDPHQQGIWFDVFDDDIQRNAATKPDVFINRNDLMLLARNGNEPQLREWRTITAVDGKNAGRTPQVSFSTCRFTYNFKPDTSQLPEIVKKFQGKVESCLSR